MSTSAKKTKRPNGLNELIGFHGDERMPASFRRAERWVPKLSIFKSGRKWIIEFDPYEGNHCSKHLTPLGAAVANHIASLGDSVFNDALGRSSHHFATNTRDILFQDTPTSYMQFKTHSLGVACTVASRLLFLPDECYTDSSDDFLPDDPIHRILSVAQRDSGTDIRPAPWE